MKRMMSILLAALLACLCAGATAEAAAPEDVAAVFSDTWLSEDNEIAAAIEVWVENGAFVCSGNRSLDGAGDEDYRWVYDDCRYDAEKKCIICTGVRTHNVFDNAAMKLNTDETVTGVTATFTVDEKDRLIWTDSEGLMDGVAFLRLDVAEAQMGDHYTPDPGGLKFDGTWVCGRASMDISAEDAGYKVSVIWAGSAWQVAQWEYACMYDAGTGTLVDSGMGVKSVVTYADEGEIASIEEVYSNGAATFAIGEDGMLSWRDDVEDAGNGMAFEHVERYDFTDGGFADDSVNSFIDDEGHFIIQITVPKDDAGEWHADDMSQDDSVVKLYYADTLEDTFVANYAPAGDGAMTVATRHFDGVACDEVYNWDLTVKEGKIAEAFCSAWTTSPDEGDQDALIIGEWVEPENGLRAMSVEKNPDVGWDVTVVAAESRGARLFTMNVRYDCELAAFVYADGKVYETAITDGGDAEPGALLRDDLTGSIRFVEGDDGKLALNWYSDLTPEETTQFVRGE